MYRAGVIGCRGIGIAHAQGLAGLENATLPPPATWTRDN